MPAMCMCAPLISTSCRAFRNIPGTMFASLTISMMTFRERHERKVSVFFQRSPDSENGASEFRLVVVAQVQLLLQFATVCINKSYCGQIRALGFDSPLPFFTLQLYSIHQLIK
jgi:hypothetical protein